MYYDEMFPSNDKYIIVIVNVLPPTVVNLMLTKHRFNSSKAS